MLVSRVQAATPAFVTLSTRSRRANQFSPRAVVGFNMTIKPRISLSDGTLRNQAGVLLSKVPDNVSLTPDSGAGQFGGAFLGAVASDSRSRHVFSLGTLRGLRFMCCFRFKLWWMTQRMGVCGSDIPHETQFLLIENGSEKEILYTIFLPIIEGSFRSSLQGNENNEVEVCVESGDPDVVVSQGLQALFICSGTNPFTVITDALRAVKSHLQSFALRDEKKLPGMLDWFGWCTWDAFYTDVSADGVRQGLESLSAGGTPPRFLIIDDGWQSVAEEKHSLNHVVTGGTQFASRLTGIRENHKFQRDGGGLGHVVEEAKATFNLKYIYVWHALVGYWGGLAPGLYQSELKYPVISPSVINNQPDMARDSLTLNGLGLVDPAKVFSFYNDLHSYLASAGVDGVKVDVQSILETLGTGHGGRVKLTKQYQQALEASIAENFPDNGCISCMSHNTDGFYSSKQTAVVRASDDFWPMDPASHTIHIGSVAYNSLFLGELMQPDWDMFHSLHPAAEYHAAARAVGGCGIYVSDKPGHHNFDLLKKLVLPDGFVLRAKLPGRPTRDCLFSDPTRDATSLLKIWNLNNHTGVLGAFNCQGAGWCKEKKINRIHDESPKAVTGSIRGSDVEFMHSLTDNTWNGDTVIYSHRAGELFVLRHGAEFSLTLRHLEFEVFTVVPLKELSPGLFFAPVGLTNMFNSGGAVQSLEYNTENVINIAVHGCGEFACYSSVKPKSVSIASVEQDFRYNSSTGLLKLELNFLGEGKLSNLRIEL